MCSIRHLSSNELRIDHSRQRSGGLATASEPAPPTWSTPREALRVAFYRPHLRKTVAIALLVGTLLFLINQLDVVLRGDATVTVWVKAAVTYFVPFCVSTAGVLVATRRNRR